VKNWIGLQCQPQTIQKLIPGQTKIKQTNDLIKHLAQFRGHLAESSSHLAEFRTHLTESSSHLAELRSHLVESRSI
jgi:hypothetical protein